MTRTMARNMALATVWKTETGAPKLPVGSKLMREKPGHWLQAWLERYTIMILKTG